MNKNKQKRQSQGEIVSDKMEKTAIVEVERSQVHPLYFKRYKVHNRIKVHNPDNKYKLGDVVVIQECRPFSKDKSYRIIKKVKKG